MTPKEQYEARKAERLKRKELEEELGRRHDEREAFYEDMMDRFVTAIERIADGIEIGEGRR